MHSDLVELAVVLAIFAVLGVVVAVLRHLGRPAERAPAASPFPFTRADVRRRYKR